MSENIQNGAQRPQLEWGYGGPWYGQLTAHQGDPFEERLEFLVKYGLKVASAGLDEIANLEPARREWLGQFLREHEMQLCPYVGWNFVSAEDDEARRKADDTVQKLQELMPLLRGTIITCVPHDENRFDRKRPVSEKLERLSRSLSPIAQAAHKLGAPLGVENHGEYYVSELVQVCQNTPHLGIFLDTGNTYLIAEKPWPAFVEAAPFTIGTHFKDHRVRPQPDASPLHFEVAGAVLGEGDVPLRECYELLLQHAPHPDKLVMEIEMVSPEDMNPLECFEKSLAFVRSLGTNQEVQA